MGALEEGERTMVVKGAKESRGKDTQGAILLMLPAPTMALRGVVEVVPGGLVPM